MQIHWRNVSAVPDAGRARVEARLHQLAAGHTDLIDVRISAKPTQHHRHGGQEVSIVGRARGRDLVASRSRADLAQALQHALEAFEGEVRRMRDMRTDRRLRKTPRSQILDAKGEQHE